MKSGGLKKPKDYAFAPLDSPITPDGVKAEPDTNHIPNYGRLFTPFWTEGVIMKPGSNGGANWPPSSYDSATHLLYVCGTDRASLYPGRPEPRAAQARRGRAAASARARLWTVASWRRWT